MAFSDQNKDIIEDIKNSANIVDIIGQYLPLKKKGSSFFGICPFHDDHDPSLSVHPGKKIFKCFVCGTKGDVFAFVQKKENISWIEAVKLVANKIGYDPEKIKLLDNNKNSSPQCSDEQKRLFLANNRAQFFYANSLKFNRYGEAANQYLSKRGLNKEDIEYFKLGYAPDNNDLKRFLNNENDFLGKLSDHEVFYNDELKKAGILNDQFNPVMVNRVTFPIHNRYGEIVGYGGRDLSGKSEAKYKISPSTEIFEKAKHLYNLHNFINGQYEDVIIVEGFMDTIAYHRAGFKNVCALMGVSIANSAINLLRQVHGLKNIILSLDNDQAGTNAIISVGQQLLESGFDVYVVDYSNIKEKDPDEIINNLSADKLKEIIKNKVNLISFIIDKKVNEIATKAEAIKIANELSDIILYHGGGSINRGVYCRELANAVNKKFPNLLSSEIIYDQLKEKYNQIGFIDRSDFNQYGDYKPRDYYETENLVFVEPTYFSTNEYLTKTNKEKKKYTLIKYFTHLQELIKCLILIPEGIKFFNYMSVPKDLNDESVEFGGKKIKITYVDNILKTIQTAIDINHTEKLLKNPYECIYNMINEIIKSQKDPKSTQSISYRCSLNWLKHLYKDEMKIFAEGKDILKTKAEYSCAYNVNCLIKAAKEYKRLEKLITFCEKQASEKYKN